MSTDKIIQVTSDSDLDILIKIDAHQLNDEDKSRIREDFHQGYFQAYFYSSSGAVDLNSITAYVVTYFSYSTWQNRVLCISDFWLASTLDEASQLEILELFRQRLFSIARLNNCKRINFHVKHSDMNQTLIRCLEKFGMRNLTREEDWNIFQLSTNELKEFIKDSPKLDDEYKIIKVEDMSLYASHIHGHIHELAVYEKLEEQFECSTEELLTDYDEAKCPTKRRLYEAMVMLNKENKTVGFAIYYTIYNLKSGIGFYLEDLFIQEAYRHGGLGTSLWKRVADDCVKLKGNYMQWAVLGWNTPAINFYYKFKSINLTETEKLNLFRFLTHQIYEKC